jgi:L-fuculose-phosphate aldolase
VHSAATSVQRAREEVAQTSRRLAAAGLVYGTSGNVSARADDRIAISPTGCVLADLGPDDVTVVDMDGAVVEGPLAPTSELDLHLGVYRRYDAGAVVHTHAPVATALSCVIDELPCVHYEMLLLGGTVRVAPYRTFGTPELAESVLDALDGRTAALMSNHGTLVYAGDLAQAERSTQLLEWAAEMYWRAKVFGEPRVLDEADRQAVVEAAMGRGYGSTKPADS